MVNLWKFFHLILDWDSLKGKRTKEENSVWAIMRIYSKKFQRKMNEKRRFYRTVFLKRQIANMD